MGGGTAALEAAHFDRVLDLRWRRASYSSMTEAAYHWSAGADNVGSEPENPGIDDEPQLPVGAGSPPADEEASAGSDWAVSPLAGTPGGREVGTFVHAVLEGIDFAAPDLAAEMDTAIRSAETSGAGIAGDAGVLGEGLAAAVGTQLGPLLPGASLRDIARADRVDELHFELPLAGGDAPDGQVSTADIAAVLTAHMAPEGPLAGYPDRLLDPLLATTLRGYLTGSLDLVFRRTSGGGVQRWYVADYKTNWLGEDGRPLTAWHYRPSALDAEMQRHHYPLQALLYLVALHRYLRWRLPGYSPEVNLGGVLYLFLRGMVGQDTPVIDGHPCGVFSWAPPAELIVGLSDLFVGGRR